MAKISQQIVSEAADEIVNVMVFVPFEEVKQERIVHRVVQFLSDGHNVREKLCRGVECSSECVVVLWRNVVDDPQKEFSELSKTCRKLAILRHMKGGIHQWHQKIHLKLHKFCWVETYEQRIARHKPSNKDKHLRKLDVFSLSVLLVSLLCDVTYNLELLSQGPNSSIVTAANPIQSCPVLQKMFWSVRIGWKEENQTNTVIQRGSNSATFDSTCTWKHCSYAPARAKRIQNILELQWRRWSSWQRTETRDWRWWRMGKSLAHTSDYTDTDCWSQATCWRCLENRTKRFEFAVLQTRGAKKENQLWYLDGTNCSSLSSTTNNVQPRNQEYLEDDNVFSLFLVKQTTRSNLSAILFGGGIAPPLPGMLNSVQLHCSMTYFVVHFNTQVRKSSSGSQFPIGGGSFVNWVERTHVLWMNATSLPGLLSFGRKRMPVRLKILKITFTARIIQGWRSSRGFTFVCFIATSVLLPAGTKKPAFDINPVDSFCPWMRTLKPVDKRQSQFRRHCPSSAGRIFLSGCGTEKIPFYRFLCWLNLMWNFGVIWDGIHEWWMSIPAPKLPSTGP